MSYKDIKEGEKVARPLGARFIRSKNDTLGIEVAFKFKEGETEERLNWIGWLSSKAMESTMKTLVEVLGYNGDDSVDANGILTNKDAFRYDQEVKLVIEMEEWDQKLYPRVKWVNSIGGSNFAGCTPETIKNDLGAVGFKAAFLAAKQQSGSQPQASKSPLMTEKPFTMDDSKLPF